MIVKYNTSGLLHSYHDQPSLVDHDRNKYWHINGKLERNGDLPCIEFSNGDKRYNLENGKYKIIGNHDEKFIEKDYNSNQTLDRVSWYDIKTNNLLREAYYLNGNYHRLDGPAILWYNNNIVFSEKYYINNKLSRLNGPAKIEYDENGNKKYEYYYINGKLHRLNGPAIVRYYINGSIEYEKYYIDDQYITKNDFFKLNNTTLRSKITS